MRRAAWLDFWVGLAFTAVLIVLKIVVEHGTFGRQVEQMTLNLQQLRLAGAASAARPPVVIDITDVPRVPRDQSADLELVTDRRRLIDLVAAAALRDPAAIGVDVLLDPPTPDAPLTPDEVQLLEFCLDVRNSRGERIPTVVGVFDGVVRGPARWLGEPRFGDLAAYLLVPKPDADAATTSMIHAVDVETTGGPARIRSLAQALADVVNARDETRWSLGRRIVDRFQLLVKRDRPVTPTSFATSEFAVNFDVVPRLRETTIRAAVPADIERSPVALRDRVVLLARAARLRPVRTHEAESPPDGRRGRTHADPAPDAGDGRARVPVRLLLGHLHWRAVNRLPDGHRRTAAARSDRARDTGRTRRLRPARRLAGTGGRPARHGA